MEKRLKVVYNSLARGKKAWEESNAKLNRRSEVEVGFERLVKNYGAAVGYMEGS